MKFIAIRQHRSEFPNPITFQKGTYLNIGEKYLGENNWDHWFFCTVEGQSGGWVPEQIIDRVDENSGYALENYTAKELEVNAGDELKVDQSLNGWMWCTRIQDGESGWVPENLLVQKLK
ncbi:hypothetical protein B9T31_09820 [Acinetobacter sp. ANC 4558]|uniref:SH3 domain-containing protein n=1 Tax=Acinetobacter sp. ANC 4558 TaxID=1977876 RepID=UPI000A35553B|nr:SH3 domain-containing protein [Acinetobacter sp. ANC 4558]OTG85879.1 hypothetical protein B9T31_09820 [Acinetobacter sp. ANC 4558]